jgi:DNA-binding FrmR family transcriptional regulator
MSHTTQDKDQLLNRIRRIRGQLEAVEKQLQTVDHDPYEVLQTLTACRGGLNGLVASIIEGHVRQHVVSPDATLTAGQSQAVEQLIEIVRTYLK